MPLMVDPIAKRIERSTVRPYRGYSEENALKEEFLHCIAAYADDLTIFVRVKFASTHPDVISLKIVQN